MTDALDDFAALARAHLSARPDCASFLPTIAGSRASKGGRVGLARANSDAIAAHLPEVAAGAGAGTSALVAAAIALRNELNWWSAYDADEPTGENFAARTAGALIFGPGGRLVGGEGRAGLFFLRSGVTYAPHAHTPREIYAILAGRARFWTPEGGWIEAGAGDVIHTAPRQWHGMKTDRAAILILWSWIGEDFDDRPVFLNAEGRFPGDPSADHGS